MTAHPAPLVAASALHAGTPITSRAQLVAALDELAALARSGQIGQKLELRASDTVTFTVDIAYPPEHGWALSFEDSDSGTFVITTNPDIHSDEAVELRWGGNWEETEAQSFIAADQARAVVINYFETGTLSDDVTWVVARAGAEHNPTWWSE